MATQTSSNGHDKQYDYTPTEYDVTTVPPRIGAGRYEAVAAASQRGTKKENLPMLVIEWTAEAVADGNEDNEQFVGATTSDFLVISDDAKFRGHKQRLRVMLERMGLSFDMVPRRIQNKSDLDELIEAINGQKISITVTHKADSSGEQRENVEYRLPREEQGGDDAGMEAAPPARGGKKPAAKSGKGARR
jgi:hypothetical protein